MLVLDGQQIDGAEVRAAWEATREEALTFMKWRVAVTSAVVIDRDGHHDLAVRLVQWARRTYPGDVDSIYPDEFARLGIATDVPVPADLPVDVIDRLMDDVLAVTDSM